METRTLEFGAVKRIETTKKQHHRNLSQFQILTQVLSELGIVGDCDPQLGHWIKRLSHSLWCLRFHGKLKYAHLQIQEVSIQRFCNL
jgi:hypothetical protein